MKGLLSEKETENGLCTTTVLKVAPGLLSWQKEKAQPKRRALNVVTELSRAAAERLSSTVVC
jgi:hypothetical protein